MSTRSVRFRISSIALKPGADGSIVCCSPATLLFRKTRRTGHSVRSTVVEEYASSSGLGVISKRPVSSELRISRSVRINRRPSSYHHGVVAPCLQPKRGRSPEASREEAQREKNRLFPHRPPDVHGVVCVDSSGVQHQRNWVTFGLELA